MEGSLEQTVAEAAGRGHRTGKESREARGRDWQARKSTCLVVDELHVRPVDPLPLVLLLLLLEDVLVELLLEPLVRQVDA